MPEISALIITLNEERNIARCIDSLQGIADEIVVLDSGSTDKTAEICRQKGVRFVSTTWKGYSETKNEGHGLLKYVWVLSLDADEALSDELKKNILQCKDNLNGVYRFPRLNNYCGKYIRYGGWYPNKNIRLFRRDEAQWDESDVHEKLIIKKGIPIHDLKGDLLHYTYYTIEEHNQRAERYARLGAQTIAKKNKPVGLKILLSPAARFIKMFFLKTGFMDGYLGYKIAAITSREVLLKYRWAKELMKSR